MQAQRKFAQVCGGSATSTLPSNLLLNQSTQHGSSKTENPNIDPPQELLPNRRPNTEDFLTFLCFRGTSVLPQHLDFFNTNKNVDQSQIKPKVENTVASCSTKDAVKKEGKDVSIDSEKREIDKADKETNQEDEASSKFIPFAVRKRADTVAAGSRKKTVQALKKKYQDQRIAKNKTPCKTRSSATKEEVDIAATTQKVKESESETKTSKNVDTDTANESTTNVRNKRKLRGNAGGMQHEEEAVVNHSRKTAKETNNQKSVEQEKTTKAVTRTTKPVDTTPAKVKNGKSEIEEETVKPTRNTRQRSYSLPKPDAKVIRLEKAEKVEKVHPTDESASKNNKKGNKKEQSVASEEEFSSDDDLPLVGKKKKKNMQEAKPKRSLKRTSNRRNQSQERDEKAGRNNSVGRKSDTSSKMSEPMSKRKSVDQKKVTLSKKSNKGPTGTEKRAESGKSDMESQEDGKKNVKPTKRKRRNEFTDLSQTDQSENETKAGRPMRKTKEAAAIYMELIGQKLNLSDCDDNLSMDSFPELPNVRKTEQMENELRANMGKEKRESATKRSKASKEEVVVTSTNNAEDVVKSTTTMASKIEKPKSGVTANKEQSKATLQKLEKSFSDSDDEPLATKIDRKSKKPRKSAATPIKRDLDAENKSGVKPDITPVKSVVRKAMDTSARKNSPTRSPPKNTSTNTLETTKTKNTSSPAKSVELNDTEFKMPAESVKQLLSPPINVSPIKIPTTRTNLNSKEKSGSFAKDSTLSLPSGKNSPQSISAILADLMPSKEESGKIFGIASVTLAQSSGPVDTKCTLGKCGSVHKPPLGPTVPTETYFGDQMTSKERRKAKVNMTHEQIEKWLFDCSMNADAFENDSLDDELDLRSPPKPINYLLTPSPIRDSDSNKEGAASTMKSKTSTPKEKPAQSSQSTLSKTKQNLPLKAETNSNKNAVAAATTNDEQIPKMDEAKSAKKEDPVKTEKTNPAKQSQSDDQKKSLAAQEVKKNPTKLPPTAQTQSPDKSISTPVTTTPDKKLIYNRRTPVYNTKKSEQSNAKKCAIVNTFGAFSPENEASIYSFDKEEDTIPASVPFRRHGRRSSTHSKQGEADKNSRKSVATIGKATKTLSPDNKSKSALIDAQSIQTTATGDPKDSSKENNVAKATAIACKDDKDDKDSDSEGHTFYIPLQCMGNVGAASDQMIQGVAVKLGTEGPNGPNQKVIMHAKLVTKSQMGSNSTPIPEGMANVQEIVRNLIANKDILGAKSVPIGTVQPLIKTSDVLRPSTSAQQTQPAETNKAVPEPLPSTPAVGVNYSKVSNLTRQSSNQSLFSPKSKIVKRNKPEHIIHPTNNTAFPRHDDPAQMVEAPVFRPSEKEFHDPIEFINRIAPIAARFGLCRIIPPSNFKPECKISDDMRFTAYNQYVNKMLHRWGPSVKELNAIKKYLATQCITLTQPPLIGGMEVDLPRLYHTVQELGGLKEVIEKKKWARVAEEMCIPKAAQDRVTKLDDIYCKYLLPYDTLSPAERQKLFDEVEADWAKSEAKARRNADRTALSDSNTNENSESEEQSEDSDDDESGDNGSMECIVKGKSMALSAFFRIARNTMALWFKNTEPVSSEVEAEFWRHVAVRDSHVCVHSGSIDSSGWGYGFPSPGPKTKNSTCSKHPWNLKVLTNNHSSILRSIGPVTGVTVPTLHVGMLFSACCWYRDPHGLPWIEYLHTGKSKIWYSVPNEQSANFRLAFTSLVPTHCQNKTVWLPCDTAMVPPHMLTDRGVSLCRTEQEPGQFVIVFPRAYTSNICTGYSISESVYFAPMSWLDTAKEDFQVTC